MFLKGPGEGKKEAQRPIKVSTFAFSAVFCVFFLKKVFTPFGEHFTEYLFKLKRVF